jgi:hypothetical protein
VRWSTSQRERLQTQREELEDNVEENITSRENIEYEEDYG